MTHIEVDDEVWASFLTLCEELEIADSERYLEHWIRQIVKLQNGADGRHWLVVCALVTRGENEVLLVGNEYHKGQPLAWNLPGGVAEPGEDLHEAVRRELAEECGLEALRVGRLAWIVQVDYGLEQPGLLAMAFEVPEWRGELAPEHRDRDGFVRASEFVPGQQAPHRIIEGNSRPLADWMTAPVDTPRLYWYDRDLRGDGPQPIDGLAAGPVSTRARE